MKMNELIFGLIMSLLVISLPVFAKPVPAPLARIETVGGLVPHLSHRELIVYHDGSVYASALDQKFYLVAKLSPAIVSNLAKAIHEINGDQLVLDDPRSLPCMDAPSTGYAVFKSDGSTVEIARRENCRVLHLKNGEGLKVARVLGGLESVAFLMK